MIPCVVISKREFMMLLTTYSSAELSFGMLISGIEAVCAIGNIILLIYFTTKEWKHTEQSDRRRKQEEERLSILQRQNLWYDKIVIERIITYLLEYFDGVGIEIAKGKFQTDQDKRNSVEWLRDENRRYKRLIIPCLEIFSHDLARSMNRSLQEYCDILISEIDDNRANYSADFHRRINDKQADILKQIYEYDFQH